ncbi:hypothetical protein CEXT_460541 [Caerostris extrusa]|uniref:Uncharacterized protein n=1 Tax=Caerostris extrusa TaxID=172846 RepID=A0AAV4NLW4_CAEEX|nr:hypothetical protein CEXT_460541 [Caerostris extrusa]
MPVNKQYQCPAGYSVPTVTPEPGNQSPPESFSLVSDYGNLTRKASRCAGDSLNSRKNSSADQLPHCHPALPAR